MKKAYKKSDFPVHEIRRFLEPGPVVLVSSHWQGKNNIMTMGWHTVMEFSPSLIGCMITAANHSYEMIRKSKECVINIPTYDLIDEIISIGNTTGADTDKFETCSLTAEKATIVGAPLIKECFASYECRVVDGSMLDKYNFFVLEVVKAHAATTPRYPKTVHYRGNGIFMVSGRNLDYSASFKPGML